MNLRSVHSIGMPDSMIVLLGAARSGTKFVRDLLATSPGVRAVPHDINYVWRYGQERAPHDVLDPEHMPAGLVGHVLRHVDRMAPGNEPTVVEKTVSNVLRIPYLVAAFPEARYIYLERRGEDVVESAMRSWQSPLQATSLRQKLRTFPWLTAGRYAVGYARALGRQLVTRDAVSTWGPRYPGIDEDVRKLPLVDVCARQWVACVEAFKSSRSLLERPEVLQYEDLVKDPRGVAGGLAERLGLDADVVGEAAESRVHSHGLGRAGRSRQDVRVIREAIERARAHAIGV